MPKLDGVIKFEKIQPKIYLPKSWVKKMGVSESNTDIVMWFDGDRITIERPAESGVKKAPLASNKRIWRFAMVWLEMYKHHATIPYRYFEDGYILGEEFFSLGFIMDCGESLKNALPDAANFFNDNEELKKYIDKLDIQTLGNAIFSQWRYWNHWAMCPMEEKDFEWFVIAFARLAELAA